MADLKPLGSEKLNGDDKLKRILELTYYNNNEKKSNSTKAEMVSESKTGGVYGIVRERDAYYVKRGLNENTLDYIGGMFMKNKNRFSSYGEAFKRLELIKGQEELQEATKYVLKQNSPKAEAPASEPSMDLPPAPPADSEPTDSMSAEPSTDDAVDSAIAPDATSDDSGLGVDGEEGGEGKRSDYMAEVQKYAGKLGQELRDLHDKMESDDIKYVLNMIISAVDLDKLDEEDIEEIAKKFDREEEEEGSEGGEEEVPSEEPSSEPTSSDDDLDENMSKLNDFINSPVDTDEIDLSKYSDLGSVDETMGQEEDNTEEIDLDEIKNEIHNSISNTLSKYFK
jgi:hypothetical protein